MKIVLNYLQRDILVAHLRANIEAYAKDSMSKIATKASAALSFTVTEGNIKGIRKQLSLPIGVFRAKPGPKVNPSPADLAGIQLQLDRLTFVVMQIANELGVKLEEKSPGGSPG